MEYNKEKKYQTGKQPNNVYDDGDIPQVDLPQNSFPEEMPVQNVPSELREYQVPYKEFPPVHPPTVDEATDVIPDDTERRDGPGGEPGIN